MLNVLLHIDMYAYIKNTKVLGFSHGENKEN